MLKTINYTIKFDSPLLIGTSASLPGVYDRMTTLDDNGLPYVPASSIRGRIKEAIRSFLRDNATSWHQFAVCEGQDPPIVDSNSDNGHLYYKQKKDKTFYHLCRICPLCRIFGAPGGLKQGFAFSGAYYPEDILGIFENTFGTDPDDLTAASLTRRVRNKRDENLRRAREDHLFVDGSAEIMASLQGKVRETPAHLCYDLEGLDCRNFDYQLLLLGMRLATELGATRNRGYGSCEFIIAEESWLKEIENLIAKWEVERRGGEKR